MKIILLKKMKLTDLDIDCIEEILKYLEFEDILSVADTNNRLRHASKFVFARKHSNTLFSLQPGSAHLFDKGVYPLSHTFMNVNNTKYIFQTLRIFGRLMSSLRIDLVCGSLLPDYINVVRYINEFCTETLERLEILLWDDLENALDCFERPFTRVKTVLIGVDAGSAQKDFLVRIFPKMEKLTLLTSCTKFMHNGHIANHFPHLKIFEILPRDPYKEDHVCSEVYRKFIRLNPQLQHLICRKIVGVDGAFKVLEAHESQMPIHCHQPNII